MFAYVYVKANNSSMQVNRLIDNYFIFCKECKLNEQKQPVEKCISIISTEDTKSFGASRRAAQLHSNTYLHTYVCIWNELGACIVLHTYIHSDFAIGHVSEQQR